MKKILFLLLIIPFLFGFLHTPKGPGYSGGAGPSCTPGSTSEDSFSNNHSVDDTWVIVKRSITVTGEACTFKYIYGKISGGEGSGRYVGLAVWDDDGTDNGPGTLLASGTHEGIASGWFTIDVSGQSVSASTGDVYVGFCTDSALMTMQYNSLSGTETVYSIAGTYDSPDSTWDEDNDTETANRDLSVRLSWE